MESGEKSLEDGFTPFRFFKEPIMTSLHRKLLLAATLGAMGADAAPGRYSFQQDNPPAGP